MSALDQLAARLQLGNREGSKPIASFPGIDDVLEKIKARAKSSAMRPASEERQLDAVRRFWDSQQVDSFQDAYLLSWGLCLPHRPQGPCVLEDRPRFQKVLDGVDGWSSQPRAYRRCYQGLVRNYFIYGSQPEIVTDAGRSNWRILRDYLRDCNGLIRDDQINPDWVDTAIGNRQLFTAHPCEPYVDALLNGDSGAIDRLCEQLGIGKASWFLRELVLAQVERATRHDHEAFKVLLPRLLALLAGNEVLRDRGLALLLDRYVKVPGMVLHHGLRDYSVQWWGNPWLPSNETRWGAVQPEARIMIADWLKGELIETFFTKLAEDGLGDRRRMEFWKRYVKAIDHIEFALGSTARNSREKDFVLLRDKMKGLTCHLDASGANNAFIMRMGDLVAVEFSGMSNAFYGYSASKSLPFDTRRVLRLEVDAHNSLKHREPRRVLWMKHQDGIHGWEKWEHMFQATMTQEFGIKPGTPSRDASGSISAGANRPISSSQVGEARSYSRSSLQRFVQTHGLSVEDKTAQGGNLWVRADETDQRIAKVLADWGFRYKAGKGWWR